MKATGRICLRASFGIPPSARQQMAISPMEASVNRRKAAVMGWMDWARMRPATHVPPQSIMEMTSSP